MTKNLPAGFDPARILSGLHTAMEFGAPTRAEDRATFVTIITTPAAGGYVDEDGVPFDPTKRPSRTPKKVVVPCAIEKPERADLAETFGSLSADRIKITLLDPEYQKVKGFDYVVVGGSKYAYEKTPPPDALGSIDVWTVICISEDEN